MDETDFHLLSPGAPVRFVLDDGGTVPATVTGWREGRCIIRIEAEHLRLSGAVVTAARPEQLAALPDCAAPGAL